MKHGSRYIWFDLIRGLSALAVCAGHLRAVMFTDYADLQAVGPIAGGFYFLTGLGHEAVMVFFVLSGFFVGGSVLGRRDRFAFSDYLVARLSRLWMVLIPALLFTALADAFIRSALPGLLAGEYHSILSSGPAPDGGYSGSIGTFLANLFFLQTLVCPVFGTNGPLWSLANEFWYYMLFPLLMTGLGVVRRRCTTRLLLLGLFCLIAAFTFRLLGGFMIWLLGVGVYLIYRKKKGRFNRWMVLLSAGLFGFSLVDSKAGILHTALGISSDLEIGLCFSLFLISLKDQSVEGAWGNRAAFIARWLSEVSYTLYVFHFPLMIWLYARYYAKAQAAFSISSLIIFLFLFTAVFIFSLLMWMLFERNTPVLRRYLEKTVAAYTRKSTAE